MSTAVFNTCNNKITIEKMNRMEDIVEDVIHNPNLKRYTEANKNRFYPSLFGVTLRQLVLLSEIIKEFNEDDNVQRCWCETHLIWTMMYLKSYPTFDSLALRLGVSVNTLKNGYS